MANVSSRCASKLGGSAGTTKISSPPGRGLSWAATGDGQPEATSSEHARIHTDDLDADRVMSPPVRLRAVGTGIAGAGGPVKRETGRGASPAAVRVMSPGSV